MRKQQNQRGAAGLKINAWWVKPKKPQVNVITDKYEVSGIKDQNTKIVPEDWLINSYNQ